MVWFASIHLSGGQLQQRKTLHTNRKKQKQVSRRKRQKDHRSSSTRGFFHLGILRLLESVAIAGSKEVAVGTVVFGKCHLPWVFFSGCFLWDPGRKKSVPCLVFHKEKQILLRSSDFSVLSSCIHQPPNTGNLVEVHEPQNCWMMILESGVAGGVDPMSILYLPFCIRIHVRTFEILDAQNHLYFFFAKFPGCDSCVFCVDLKV